MRLLPDEGPSASPCGVLWRRSGQYGSGTIEPISQVIAEWKHTAEIYADPELYAALTAGHGDVDSGMFRPRRRPASEFGQGDPVPPPSGKGGYRIKFAHTVIEGTAEFLR
ncbi:hypothetical protein GCM10023238_36730 [Streptomyces heliomycini]